MTHNEKDLLLKDLCARQMYNVKCKVFDDANPYTLSGVLHNKPYSQLYFEELDWKECDGFVGVEYCKPYLLPLSSMTEVQKNELEDIGWSFDKFDHYEISNVMECLGPYRNYVSHSDSFILTDWLNKNHFDYRGLIPMGLAIDATGLDIY